MEHTTSAARMPRLLSPIFLKLGKVVFCNFSIREIRGENVIILKVAANLVFELGKFGEFTPSYKREKSLKWLEKPNYFNQNIGVFILNGR